jgi:uncharacterized protein with HEPN domain
LKRTERLYLTDILEAIGRIEKYVENITLADFSRNIMVVDAVIRNFEIIGEAAKQISAKTKKENPQVQWREMAGMRDKLAHEYFGVDTEILWKTAKLRLPTLKPQVEELLRNTQESN